MSTNARMLRSRKLVDSDEVIKAAFPVQEPPKKKQASGDDTVGEASSNLKGPALLQPNFTAEAPLIKEIDELKLQLCMLRRDVDEKDRAQENVSIKINEVEKENASLKNLLALERRNVAKGLKKVQTQRTAAEEKDKENERLEAKVTDLKAKLTTLQGRYDEKSQVACNCAEKINSMKKELQACVKKMGNVVTKYTIGNESSEEEEEEGRLKKEKKSKEKKTVISKAEFERLSNAYSQNPASQLQFGDITDECVLLHAETPGIFISKKKLEEFEEKHADSSYEVKFKQLAFLLIKKDALKHISVEGDDSKTKYKLASLNLGVKAAMKGYLGGVELKEHNQLLMKHFTKARGKVMISE